MLSSNHSGDTGTAAAQALSACVEWGSTSLVVGSLLKNKSAHAAMCGWWGWWNRSPDAHCARALPLRAAESRSQMRRQSTEREFLDKYSANTFELLVKTFEVSGCPSGRAPQAGVGPLGQGASGRAPRGGPLEQAVRSQREGRAVGDGQTGALATGFLVSGPRPYR
jgi:hypothetical protein